MSNARVLTWTVGDSTPIQLTPGYDASEPYLAKNLGPSTVWLVAGGSEAPDPLQFQYAFPMEVGETLYGLRDTHSGASTFFWAQCAAPGASRVVAIIGSAA